MHIDHINISASRELLEQVKEFYCYIFDLTEGFRPEFSRNGFWLYSDDKALIHLTESDQHHFNEKQSHLDHIAFQTTGLAEMITRLKKRDVSFKTDHLPEIGMTQLFFKDPAGTGLEANFLNELYP